MSKEFQLKFSFDKVLQKESFGLESIKRDGPVGCHDSNS